MLLDYFEHSKIKATLCLQSHIKVVQALFSHLLITQGGNSCLIWCQIYLHSKAPEASSSSHLTKDAWLRRTVQLDSSSGLHQVLVQTYCGELRGLWMIQQSSRTFQLWFLLQNPAGVFAAGFTSMVLMVWTLWPRHCPMFEKSWDSMRQ